MNLKGKRLIIIFLCLTLASLFVITSCTTTNTATVTATSTSTATSTVTATIKPIKLVFGNCQPATHPFAQADIAWMDRIEELTGGRVVFEHIPGGALMHTPEAFNELAEGVADVSDFTASFIKEGFDIEKAMQMLFYGAPNWEVTREVYYEVRAKYPEIDAEFSAVKVMGYTTIPAYQLMMVSTPVRQVADFKGLSIKTSGKYSSLATALGAEAAPVPLPDLYIQLQKHTVDGGFSPYETLKSLNFADVIKYVTHTELGNPPTPHRGMNWDTWNSLPADIQKIFDDNIEWYSLKCDEMIGAVEQDGIELGKENGVEFIEMSPEELAKFYEILDGVVVEEMAALDAKGLPGTAIYDDVRRLIKEYSE